MANTDYKSVDEYIAAQPEAVQATLRRVRAIICKAMPGADEVISYQIPAYKLQGKAALYFAGWKQHYSLYPASTPLVAAFKEELAAYEVSKGTIRFPLDKAVPAKLIEGIAKFRVVEMPDLVAAAKRKRTSAAKAKAARPTS